MSFLKLIEKKNERLEKVPDKFLSKVQKTEREIYRNIIALLSRLTITDGYFETSVENIQIAGAINDELHKVLLESEYTMAVSEFAGEFDLQGDLNFDYFKKAFDLKEKSDIALAALNRGKANAVDLLLNRAADSEFISPLRDIIEQSVINNASYSDTLQAINEFVQGDEETESRLMRYSRQIAHDTFAVTDASVSSVYSDEIEAEFFFYSGDIIPTSRKFCIERHNQYFHYKEIEAWGRGEKTTGMSLPNSDGSWPGEIEGTNEKTIWSYRGGYFCGHSIMPVSVFDVPMDVIQRAIDQGFYSPSEKEAELLEL